MNSQKKPRCHNCKFGGTQFKIGKLTHLHCENDELFPKEKFQNGTLSAWDSLQVFNDTCNNHKFKENN